MTLVVIDLQHVFADPTSDWAAPRFFDVLPNVETLVDIYGDDSVFTRFVAPDEPRGAWRDYYRAFPFALQPTNSPLWDLVAPFTGRPTFDATTFGKWDEQLADRVDDELVVAGVATDCCVVSTVLAATDAGVHVRVVSDACAGSSDDAHQQAITVMSLYAPLVEITTTDDEVVRRGADSDRRRAPSGSQVSGDDPVSYRGERPRRSVPYRDGAGMVVTSAHASLGPADVAPVLPDHARTPGRDGRGLHRREVVAGHAVGDDGGHRVLPVSVLRC